jgi:MinD superfamily P-loop ATPase
MEIAIISGKGGTGKSSISAAFATMNGNIVLADCDVDAANLFILFDPSRDEEEVYIAGHKAEIDYSLCTSCGICSEYCRFDAIAYINDRIEINEISCDGCFLCSRVCPENAIKMVPNDKSRMYSGNFRNGKMVYGRLAPGEENSGKLVSMVREKAKNLAKSGGIENIILDGPPGIGCPVISTITGTDKVLIVTEPTISGLSDLKRAAEIVRKFGISSYVIVNKHDLNSRMTGQIIQWCKTNGVTLAGTLPFDQMMVKAMIGKKSINEYDPENAISLELKQIWYNILNDN